MTQTTLSQMCFNKPCTEPFTQNDLDVGVQVQHDWDDDQHELKICLRCDVICYKGILIENPDYNKT